MKILKIMVPILSILAIFAAVGSADTANTTVPDISLEDLKKAIADKSVVLIDCNGSKSYAEGHIPGAINFEDKKDELAKILPNDKGALVVAYCGGPMCDAYKAGVDAATKEGCTNVKHFSLGISGWKSAGEKLEVADLCQKCGLIKGTELCCKADQPKCEKCGLIKESPGCCKLQKKEEAK